MKASLVVRALQFIGLNRSSSWACLTVLSLLGFTGCTGDRPVTIFAAASLADGLEEAELRWREQDPSSRSRIAFHFAGSGTLVAQAAAGAPVDALLVADRQVLERLPVTDRNSSQSTAAAQAIPFLANRLVVIGRTDDPENERVEGPEDLLRFRLLALADPEVAPVGAYAYRWLEAEGLAEQLADRSLFLLDARAVLAAVVSGAAPVGVVYASDARSTDRVEVLFEIPEPRPRYWVWIPSRAMSSARDEHRVDRARSFVDFLLGPEGQETLSRHGFVPISSPESFRREAGSRMSS